MIPLQNLRGVGPLLLEPMLFIEKLENFFDLRVDITFHVVPPNCIILQHSLRQCSDGGHAGRIQFP